MDQYIEQARKQAVETLCSQDPAVAEFCKQQEAKCHNMDLTANNNIDFNSMEYQSNLRLYVQDIDHCNYQQL